MKYVIIFVAGLLIGGGSVYYFQPKPTATREERISDARAILQEQLDSLGVDTMSIRGKAELLERWAREKRGENR